MGTIRRRGDTKEWFVDYIDATGRRIRQTIGAGDASKKLARKILVQREAEATLGQHRVFSAQTPRFAEFADGWHRRNRARGLRLRTLEGYEATDRVHLRPAFGEIRLGAIGRREVEAFLADLRETGTRRAKGGVRVPLSATTVNYVLSILKFILKDAVEQGELEENPAAAVRPVRDPNRDHRDTVQIFTPEEITRLLTVATEPFQSLYRLAVHSGMRRGELLALRQSDLDLHRGVVHVRKTRGRVRDGGAYVVAEGPGKTRAARRTIEVSRAVLLALPAGDEESDHVFRGQDGRPLNPGNVDKVFKRHLVLAELSDLPFHATRHTHASLLIAAGVNVKAIQVRLGHESITTTLDTYGHLLPEAFQGVPDRLDALLQGTGKAQAVEAEAAIVREPQ